MEEAIKNFNQQLLFDPKIENPSKLEKFSKFTIMGMGGSHLAADLLKLWKQEIDLIVHKNYGLPPLIDKNRLYIANSYSGNTEETLDFFNEALAKNLPLAAVSVGGKLLKLCNEKNIPYIKLPDTGIQPRAALGFNLKALLKLMGETEVLKDIESLAEYFTPAHLEAEGKKLAELLRDFVPVIYASEKNKALAYNWKVEFNETGKIPAFYNVFPELNHNEMEGFAEASSTKHLSQKFYFIVLWDNNDHPRIIKRMRVMKTLFKKRGLPLITITIEGKNVFEKMFSSVLLADWTALHIAKIYKTNPDRVPLIEEFKKLI